MIPDRSTRRAPSRSARLPVVILAALLPWAAGPAQAQKTDVVVLGNGDAITGEVKKLERGQLTYKTDSAGTLTIEWTEVLRLTSQQQLEFERSDGSFFFGALAAPDADGELRVVVGAGTVDLPLADVVRITPIKQTVWSRVDGSLGFSFNYAKSSDILTFNFTSNATYRTRKYLVAATINSTITDQSDEDRSENYEIDGTYRYFLPKRRFVVAGAKAERNSELDLDLRITVGGGYGWKLTQSNHSLLLFSAGLNTTTEYDVGNPDPEQNMEAAFNVAYSLFFYNTPKTDVTLSASWFPYLTTSSRHRLNATFNARRELISDFFIQINGWFKYDSRPPSDAAAKTDWYLGLGLSWTF